MRFTAILAATAAVLANTASAAGVVGAAEGFAKGVTGGGNASPVYPNSNSELVGYLTDNNARVIILTKTFDFTGSEGSVSETGCAPWGTASNCQTAINGANNWCGREQPSAPKVNVRYDKAGVNGIQVKSNKSIVGQGSAGVIKGKGLRMAGSKNVIIQNIHVTNINPQYVWGGDAITIDGGDMIWIDHVKTSLIGRQHVVLGNGASNRVTISNSEFDGSTSWSATCNGQHYWNMYLTGSNDLVTLKGNYFHHFSGRAPKVAGNTLLHAVNNYWWASAGHAFEVDSGAMVLVEGSVFQNVPTILDKNKAGQLFTSPDGNSNSQCQSGLGRACVANSFGSSGSFKSTDTGFLGNFKGKNIASAAAASASIKDKAGVGKI